MDATLDLSRWTTAPKGVGYRRWTIISMGLRRLLRTRFFKFMLGIAWMSGLLIAVFGFMFSQTLATGGWLETYAVKIGPRAEAVAKVVTGLVALYPDVVVHTLFTIVFWLHSFVGLTISLVALTIMIPQLVTRDQATNALIIYLSRPLTTLDYLLGKFGTIVGVLLLLWTGPLLLGWMLSMAFATDRDFLLYSLTPLLRALLFNGIALVVLSAIALGVSAIARSSMVTIFVWLGVWLIAWFTASFPDSPWWLERVSFMHDLGQVRAQTLRLDEALTDAATNLPLMDQDFVRGLKRGGEKAGPEDFKGALYGLAFLTAASGAVFFRKLRPE